MTRINNSLLLSLIRRVGHLNEGFRDKASTSEAGGDAGGSAGGRVGSWLSDHLIIDSSEENERHLCSGKTHRFVQSRGLSRG